ncbi:EFR1 family ferrodoxin [Acetivibrio cellulolyticus]|uniref:EFR1 family ferrodoxin n=1 Tax=Acetivibrio cellulolyticus TaxID=35830 RepID=UPI0001E2EB95|nr:EFR1 family ferrodoxin [Acetivibrio cellulolyticus]
MKNVIFYFTGTGNSLAVAKKLANKIGDTEVIAISNAIKEKGLELNYERIGFVFPVYYYLPPNIVREFVNRLSFSKAHYIFAVATYGGIYGGVFKDLYECIKNSGGVLNAAFSLCMPGNYIVEYGAFPEAITNFQSKWEKRRVGIIAENVLQRKSQAIPKGNFISNLFTEYSYKKVKEFKAMAVNFHENGSCNGCAVCSKICPVGNININDGKPTWGNNCEHCMACIQWCPHKAIEYGNVTQKRRRYKHSEISLKEMMLDESE